MTHPPILFCALNDILKVSWLYNVPQKLDMRLRFFLGFYLGLEWGLETGFCLMAPERALDQGKPEILNSDQGVLWLSAVEVAFDVGMG